MFKQLASGVKQKQVSVCCTCFSTNLQWRHVWSENNLIHSRTLVPLIFYSNNIHLHYDITRYFVLLYRQDLLSALLQGQKSMHINVHQSLHEYLTCYIRGTKLSCCDVRGCLWVLHLMFSMKGGEAQGESWQAAQESFSAFICWSAGKKSFVFIFEDSGTIFTGCF